MNGRPKVLMIAPGPRVRGGISAVLLSYRRNGVWPWQPFEWLSTYDDRGALRKIAAAARAFALALIRIPRYDIIHIHAAHRTSFYRKTVFFVMAKCLRKKTVIHLHAPDFKWFQEPSIKRFSRWVFQGADAVITLSETWAREVRTIAPKANLWVVPNPCEIPKAPPRPLTERKPVVLFSGKLESRKGFLDLIKAMPGVLARIPDAKLVMAGHGAIDEARALARLLGIEDRVECLGWIDNEKKATLLSESRVFCLPSYGEGVPMAMLEAMSCGVPVVVTPVGGIPDVVTNGSSGIVVRPGDIAAISDAVVSLLLQIDLAQRIAETGLQVVRTGFRPELVVARLIRLYNGLESLAAGNLTVPPVRRSTGTLRQPLLEAVAAVLGDDVESTSQSAPRQKEPVCGKS